MQLALHVSSVVELDRDDLRQCIPLQVGSKEHLHVCHSEPPTELEEECNGKSSSAASRVDVRHVWTDVNVTGRC